MRNIRKEYLTLHYINYVFIAFIVLVLGYFLFFKTNISLPISNTADNKTDKYVIPEVKVLTSEEVATEKQKFASRDLDPSVVIKEIEAEEVKTVFVPQESVPEINEDTQIRQEQSLNSNSSGETDSTLNNNLENPRDESGIVKFQGTFAVANGIIYSKDEENNRFTVSLSDNSGLTTVQIWNETSIKINDAKIKLSDLNIGDKVRVEGFSASGILEAKVVLFTGSLQIIPIY